MCLKLLNTNNGGLRYALTRATDKVKTNTFKYQTKLYSTRILAFSLRDLQFTPQGPATPQLCTTGVRKALLLSPGIKF